MKIEVLKSFTLPGSPRPFLPRERIDVPDADARCLIDERKAVQWPYVEQGASPVAASQPTRRRRETATR